MRRLTVRRSPVHGRGLLRRLAFLKPHRMSAMYEEHAKMLRFIDRGKCSEAAMLLRAHITQGMLEVRKIAVRCPRRHGTVSCRSWAKRRALTIH
jgi:DNA-binding GntR family transcriptional regulator